MKKKIAQEQDHLMKSLALRRLPTPYVLQRFHLFNSKCEQILATSLKEEQEKKRARAKSGRGDILA
jgi:hypothetical protein